MNSVVRIAKQLLVAVSLISGCAVSSGATAKDFPERPVRMVVVDPPGSAVDVVARLLAEKMAVRLKQPVLVENKAGASGTIAANYVAKSQPDGYTILLTGTFTEAIVPFVMSSLPYDYRKDLTPVAEVCRLPFALVTGAASPIKSLKDLPELARQRPQGLTVGGLPRGSGLHLAWERIGERLGVASTYVPYNSSNQLETDAVNGTFDIAIDTIHSARGFIEGGRTKGIAVTGKNRAEVLPNVPTLGESGLTDMEAIVWVGALAPTGVPAQQMAILQSALIDAARNESVTKTLSGLGYVVTGRSGAELADAIRQDRAVYEPLVKRLDIRMN